MPKCSFHMVWMPARLVAKDSCNRSYGAQLAAPRHSHVHLEDHVALDSQVRDDALQFRDASLVLHVATAANQHQPHVRKLVVCAWSSTNTPTGIDQLPQNVQLLHVVLLRTELPDRQNAALARAAETQLAVLGGIARRIHDRGLWMRERRRADSPAGATARECGCRSTCH